MVTYLEMRHAAPARPIPDAANWDVRETRLEAEAYRALFKRIGEDWLWCSRLTLSDDALTAVLAAPERVFLVLKRAGAEAGLDAAQGLLELDRQGPTCEVAYFGVTPEAVASTAARHLMNAGIARAFGLTPAIDRLFLHTCTFDHPRALAFYERSGFDVTHQEVEVMPDPRLSGLLRVDAAPHVPRAAGSSGA